MARTIIRHDLGYSPLLVISRSRPGDRNAAAYHWSNRRRVSIHAIQGRLYTRIRSLYWLGGRVLTVIEVGTNRKRVCDFLLVINSNWHPMSYRFWVIAAYCSNFGHCMFEPPFGGLSGHVWCSSWAHRKSRNGLPISVNWTFFARCYGSVATSEYRLKMSDFTRRGPVGQIFHVEGVAPTNHTSSQKTRLSFVWYKNLDRSFFHFITNYAFDRRTDRQNSHR